MIYTEYERNLINKSKLEGEKLATIKHINSLHNKGFNPEFISKNLDIPYNEVLKALESD